MTTELPKTGVYPFVAEPFHADFTGRLKLGILGNHLLNVAGLHSADRGFGISELNRDHRTWVLSRLSIETESLPRPYEPFRIETWVEGVYRYFTTRNFEVFNREGASIVRAHSVWAVIDLTSRKPVDLMLAYGEGMSAYVSDRPCPMEKMSRSRGGDKVPWAEIEAKYSDIDINGHVNSMRYIEHALDLLPANLHREKRLTRFEVSYVAESRMGDKLAFCAERKEEQETYDMEVVKNGSETVCRMKMVFGNY